MPPTERGAPQIDGASQPGNWVDALADTFRPRDHLFLEPGPRGELSCARARLAAFWLLLAVVNMMELPAGRGTLVLQAAAWGLALALLAYVVVTRRYRAWLGYGLTALDVSAVTLFWTLLSSPETGLRESSPFFELYFLVLILAGLRDRTSLVAFATALAAIEYAAVGAWSGTFSLDRVALLVAAGALQTLLVARGRRLHPLSPLDPLTGLLRRAPFEEWLGGEIARARRHRRHAALALVQVDDFDELKRQHGSARGDAVLRAVGRSLNRTVRSTDGVARFASATFGLALVETRADVTLKRFAEIRERVEVESRGGADPGARAGATVSIGVAGWPDDGEALQDLIAAAEARLHQARRSAAGVQGPEPASPPV